MTRAAVLPQKIVDREIVVLKTYVDLARACTLATARLLVERKKKLTARLSPFKSDSYEMRFISAQKYYEPYIVVGGKYAVDYCKRYIFKARIDPRTEFIVIHGRSLKPEQSSGRIRFEGEGHFHYENQARFILDGMGREVMSDELAHAAHAEEQLWNREEVSGKLMEVKVSPQQVIEFLRSRIAERPADAANVTREWFEINQHTVIYIPSYELTFQNMNTGKTEIVKIDGISGQMRMDKRSRTRGNA